MAVHVRRTTGLLLLFTLLTLINHSSSLFHKEYLDILQEYLQGGIIEAAEKKAEHMNKLRFAEYYHEELLEELHPILQQLIDVTNRSPLLGGFKSAIINLLVKEQTEFAIAKKALENEIEEIWDFIELQEYGHDEL